MTRISKRTREEAIEACLLAADYWHHADGRHPMTVAPPHIDALTGEAFQAVYTVGAHMQESFSAGCTFAWLECAALLRGDDEHEPWSPGMPVYLRGAP